MLGPYLVPAYAITGAILVADCGLQNYAALGGTTASFLHMKYLLM